MRSLNVRRSSALFTLVCLVAVGSMSAQNPLHYYKNYILTGGDYAVGGWNKDLSQPVVMKSVTINGVATSVPYVTGTLAVPDTSKAAFFRPGVTAQGVPAGADVVAAFLYWQTVESTTQSAQFGQTAFFQSTQANAPQYPITGTILQSASPVGWSAGGCTGSSGGTKNITSYRADVLRYLDVVNGVYSGNGSYNIMFADGGGNGSSTPFTLGATLVIVYRDVNSPKLDAVVIYDGSYAASNQAPVTSQVLQGFYQPSVSVAPIAKLTHIVGNGQINKSESVTFGTSTGSNVNLQSLYQSNGTVLPPFPGLYNGFWDNPTWFPNSYGNAVVGSASTVSTATTVVTPDPTVPDCVSWGAVVFKTDLQDTDGDGLMDLLESQSGLTDPTGNPLPDLHAMKADPNVRDIFTEIDYMVGTDHNHKPSQAVLDMVGDAFCKRDATGKCTRIQLHFDVGSGYPLSDPYVIQAGPTVTLQGGQAIGETACDPNSQSCLFPNYAGTVGWKSDFLRYKNGDPTTNLPARFSRNRKDMFHYALFAHTLGLPRWLTIDQTLNSVAVSGGVATITTGVPHLLNPGDSRITISGAPVSANIDGVYTVASVIDPQTFTVNIPATNNAPDTPIGSPYRNPGLAVGNGIPRSTSGVGDPYGGDFMITLGRWDNKVGTTFMQASTLMHELGHNLGLGHAGDYLDANNCKPNYQSVMNYLFQVAGLVDPTTGASRIDYSGIVLPDLDETNLSEQNGMNYVGLPYLPRWYAPASSALAQQLMMSPIGPLRCDGTPITDGAQVVRADGDVTTVTTGSIDWNWSKIIDAGFFQQDVSFDGVLSGANLVTPTAALKGFADWPNVKLNQVGARRNFVFSLDVGLAEDTGNSLLTNTASWTEVTSDWSDPTVLGSGSATGVFGSGSATGVFGSGSATGVFGSGSATGVFGSGSATGVFGSGSATGVFGEQDVETASSNGNTPYGLTAIATKVNIDLDWSAPHLGTVNFYEVWRGTCPKTGACTINNSSPAILATVPSAGNNCDGGHMYCDTTTKNGVLYLYFVEASIAYPDGASRHTGPSNIVTKSR